MLDVNGRHAMVAEALQDLVGFFRRFDRAFQFHLAAGEIVVLDVDE
jgi:hypothetical protein